MQQLKSSVDFLGMTEKPTHWLQQAVATK